MSNVDITKIDKNFLGEEIIYEGMTFHSVFDSPFKLYGFYKPYENRTFQRMPSEIAAKLNESVKQLYMNTSGGRIRFRTDSTKILLRSILPNIVKFDHMPKTGVSCFDLYLDGNYKNNFRQVHLRDTF